MAAPLPLVGALLTLPEPPPVGDGVRTEHWTWTRDDHGWAGVHRDGERVRSQSWSSLLHPGFALTRISDGAPIGLPPEPEAGATVAEVGGKRRVWVRTETGSDAVSGPGSCRWVVEPGVWWDWYSVITGTAGVRVVA